jgi:hypothetical protein
MNLEILTVASFCPVLASYPSEHDDHAGETDALGNSKLNR